MESKEAGDAKVGHAHSRRERAHIEAQNAVQWLARVTRSYAPSATDDVTLLFYSETLRVVTPEIAAGTRLGLDLAHLVLQFEENGKPTPHALDVDDRSTTEVEGWLLAELLHRGLDRDRFDKRLPYDWPHPMSGDEVKYTAHDLADELEKLARSLATAAMRLIEKQEIMHREGTLDFAKIPFSPKSFSIEIRGGSHQADAPGSFSQGEAAPVDADGDNFANLGQRRNVDI